MTMTDQLTSDASGPVVARAGTYYRRTRYIMFVVLFGYGIWSIYDGFVGWPKHNEEYNRIQSRVDEADRAGNDKLKVDTQEELRKHGEKKSDFNITFNRVVACALPPLSVLMLLYVLRSSRGEIRMENQTLFAPGHPPVPFGAIREVDTRLWDRKGIAYVTYSLESGQSGKITLDDFIYDRPPIDKIYDTIMAYLKGDSAPLEAQVPDAQVPDAQAPDAPNSASA